MTRFALAFTAALIVAAAVAPADAQNFTNYPNNADAWTTLRARNEAVPTYQAPLPYAEQTGAQRHQPLRSLPPAQSNKH